MSHTNKFEIELNNFDFIILQNCADILQEFYLFVKRITKSNHPDSIKVFENITIDNCLCKFKLIGQTVKEVFYFILLDRNLHRHIELFFSFASIISTYNFSIANILNTQRRRILNCVVKFNHGENDALFT